jgi:hypothetical protein
VTGKILDLNVYLELSAVFGCGIQGHLGGGGLRLIDRFLNRGTLAGHLVRDVER